MDGSSRECKQREDMKPWNLEMCSLESQAIPFEECSYLPNSAVAMTVYEMWSGLPQFPLKKRRPPAEKIICINNDFTSALLADGPDLEKVCRQSLKYDFCFSGDLEFFCVSLNGPHDNLLT